MANAEHDKLPLVWGVSGYQLADSFRQVLPEYAGRFRFELIRAHSDEALGQIRKRLKHEQCDVLISAGATAAYLKGFLHIPVIAVRIGGFDIMDSLVKARRVSDKIGIVLHKTAAGGMREFAASFSLPVEIRFYDTVQEARNATAELATLGVHAVVGGGLSVHMAEAAGMAGFFVYTPESIRLAMEDALNLAKAKLLERSRHSLLNTVLYNLSDGVLAVDTRGRLVAANKAADVITRQKLTGSLGASLNTLLPDLRLDPSVPDGAQGGIVEDIAGHAVVVDRTPLVEASRQIGTVLTLHSPGYVERAFSKLRAHAHRRSLAARYTLEDIVAESPNMRAVIKRCTVFAEHSDATVLLYGPSGSGKELLAQGIHNAGGRKRHPFVAVNCGAFPENLLESELFGYEEGAFTGARRKGKPGLFEVADKGTIFFDEIAELPLLMQTRLLRVLQEREITRVGGHDAIPVDIRIIAATHRDLAQLVRQGAYREDLFYRLSVLRAVVPPLRERPEDLAILFHRFLAAALERIGLDGMLPEVLSAAGRVLGKHTWPGNVRELENVVERLAMACLETRRAPSASEVLALLDLPETEKTDAAGTELEHVRMGQEKAHILEVMRQCRGGRAEMARRLGVSRTTLWRLLKRHSLDG